MRIHLFTEFITRPFLLGVLCLTLFSNQAKAQAQATIGQQNAPMPILYLDDTLAIAHLNDGAGTGKDGTPLKVGECLDFEINAGQMKHWVQDGRSHYQCKLVAGGAKGLGLIFSQAGFPFDLAVRFSTTAKDTDTDTDTLHFTYPFPAIVPPLPGDTFQLELSTQFALDDGMKIISNACYFFRPIQHPSAQSAKSRLPGCEVNVHCAEGDNWTQQTRSVVKILSKVNQNLYYCSGTLVNNTANDGAPLLLTAAHCAEGSGGDVASDADLALWIFYFNHETADCAGSIPSSNEASLTGAIRLATSEGNTDPGSDFLLLRLMDPVPDDYGPFYCGWDRKGDVSLSGVGIHHPNGDYKKISTYTQAVVSDTWSGTADTHWKVNWSATANGHGVTEPGSSGSPLFNSAGQVIGTLTGGDSDCNNQNQPDYYGKVSYSWSSNGATANRQLKPWLDPLNTGVGECNGYTPGNVLIAQFGTQQTQIPEGGRLTFTDFSSGNPTEWHWYFEGANPPEFIGQSPQAILYPTVGSYNVSLVVKNAFAADSIARKGFITVSPIFYPNPTSQSRVYFTPFPSDSSQYSVQVFDDEGRLQKTLQLPQANIVNTEVELPGRGNLFLLRLLRNGDPVVVKKIITVGK